jgi:hypothetical protein
MDGIEKKEYKKNLIFHNQNFGYLKIVSNFITHTLN